MTTESYWVSREIISKNGYRSIATPLEDQPHYNSCFVEYTQAPLMSGEEEVGTYTLSFFVQRVLSRSGGGIDLFNTMLMSLYTPTGELTANYCQKLSDTPKHSVMKATYTKGYGEEDTLPEVRISITEGGESKVVEILVEY